MLPLDCPVSTRARREQSICSPERDRRAKRKQTIREVRTLPLDHIALYLQIVDRGSLGDGGREA